MKMKENSNVKREVVKETRKKLYKRDINKGYVILYLTVLILIVLGEVLLAKYGDGFSIQNLVQDTIGNLMGVLAAFLIFDIAHEKISRDSYASMVSEQILDTLMYHPEAMDLYENEQKKIFVNEFIKSIIKDEDVAEMINYHLNSYLLTEADFRGDKNITEKDCRIRPEFSYRFVLETERTKAFSKLEAEIVDGKDPYFYVQEELNYRVKYLEQKGNYTNDKLVKIGFIYDNAALDRFLRGNPSERNERLLQNCLFREGLDIEEVDREMLQRYAGDKDKRISLIKEMFRPHLNIDNNRGEIENVEIIPDCGVVVEFKVDHDTRAMEHTVDVIFHVPKKWNTVIEVALVEPTKDPHISLSYNEDLMDVEMFAFLNKGETSAYENTSENENGIFSISLSDEWVFPISGVVFPVKRDEKINA